MFAPWSLVRLAVAATVAVAVVGCSDVLIEDPKNGDGGGGGGGDGGLDQCVNESVSPTSSNACKECMKTNCAAQAMAYCGAPAYADARACYAKCPNCSNACGHADEACQLSCSAGDSACCSVCDSQQAMCKDACPVDDPVCDCVQPGTALFDAMLGIATCFAVSCATACMTTGGPCGNEH